MTTRGGPNLTPSIQIFLAFWDPEAKAGSGSDIRIPSKSRIQIPDFGQNISKFNYVYSIFTLILFPKYMIFLQIWIFTGILILKRSDHNFSDQDPEPKERV